MVYKPNIYIYTEEKTLLNVTLDFPKGGRIVASMPKYGNGWNISMDTNGTIDNKFDYLFYESNQPYVWQKKKGWCINKDDLTDFFSNNLEIFGFASREIVDFTNYWIPKLTTAEFYNFTLRVKN